MSAGLKFTVTMPGLVDQRLREGDFQNESPDVWRRYKLGIRARHGTVGYSWRVALNAGDWLDITEYLGSVEGALIGVIQDDGDDGDRSLQRALRKALARIIVQVPEASLARRRWAGR